MSGGQLVSFHREELVRIGIVHASAVVDTESMRDFGETVVRYIEKRPGIWLLLNFENVQYLSSAAITELIRINDAVKKAGGHLQICGLSKDIYKIFKLTNMHKLLPLNHRDHPHKATEKFVRAASVSKEDREFEARR